MSSDRMKSSHYAAWARSRVKKPVKPALLTKQYMKGRYLRFSWRTNSWQFQDSITMCWRNVDGRLARCLAAAGYEVREEMTECEPAQLAFEF